jgi:hypothetical protein
VTDPERKLKDALNAIDDAVSALQRAQHAAPESHDIRRALSELDDAETYIPQAVRGLPD